MVSRIRALRSVPSGDSASGELFPDSTTSQNPSAEGVVADVISRTDEDGGIKRGRAMDDESQLLDVDQLYPASRELNTRLSAALGLLLLAIGRLEQALNASRSNDPLGADDQVNHLLITLQEMFCFRDLGEGFGNIVSACIASIQNSAGEPFSEKQIVALSSALRTLRKKPFLAFESSLEVIDRLDDANLNVNAEGLEPIQDWLSGNGVR